jgi:hypothetical protein
MERRWPENNDTAQQRAANKEVAMIHEVHGVLLFRKLAGE